MWTKDDKLSVAYFKSFIQRINTNCNKLSIRELPEKENGDFLFCEETELIERTLQNMSNVLLLNYEKKNFYNLSTFSYKDLNKWEEQLDLIENKIKNITIYKYTDNVIDTQNTYRKLLYK